MATIFRLGSRQVLNRLLRHEQVGMLSLVRSVTLKPEPAPVVKPMGHDERNKILGRPQSPHLTIYSPQLTSMLSITHRATGMMLAGYTILFGAGAILLPETIPTYIDKLAADPNSFYVGSIKFLVAFPLSYHFWNGIRHLLWDMGFFLTLRQVYVTGYIMLLLAIATTVALMVATELEAKEEEE